MLQVPDPQVQVQVQVLSTQVTSTNTSTLKWYSSTTRVQVGTSTKNYISEY